MDEQQAEKTAAVRAKFTVYEHRENMYGGGKTVVLTPQYDSSIPEDQRYNKATPSGELTMYVTNSAALEKLALGKTFYLDFIPAE